MDINFEIALNSIKLAYEDLGHTLGYRFLYSSKNTFSSEFVFINLNPGGNYIPKDHPSDSCEDGPAHLIEIWDRYPSGKSPLQIQVQKLFALLSEKVPAERNLIYSALITNFIPFRSKSFEDLHSKEASIRFSLKLWKDILSITKPKLIICTGNIVFSNLKKIYNDHIDEFSLKLNWGKVIGEIYFYKDRTRILHLPNLSRYKIFRHPESEAPLNLLFEKATENW